MRKMYIELKVRIVVDAEEDLTATEIVNELQYEINSGSVGADVVDTEIKDFEVTDSK